MDGFTAFGVFLSAVFLWEPIPKIAAVDAEATLLPFFVVFFLATALVLGDDAFLDAGFFWTAFFFAVFFVVFFGAATTNYNFAGLVLGGFPQKGWGIYQMLPRLPQKSDLICTQ